MGEPRSPLAGLLARFTSISGRSSGYVPESEWFHSVHIVNFDVDVGHVLEYSSHSSALGQADGCSLCLQAMPDSQPASGGLGDTCFAFRFVREGGSSAAANNPLWGFSFFRAHRSPDAPRGVVQKALVLLTPLPLFELFRAVVALLGEGLLQSSGLLPLGLCRVRAW